LKRIAIKIVPYIFFLGLSCAALYVFFYEGLIGGDDIKFHLANINDQFTSLVNEGSIPRISSYLASNLGMGTRLFYSPLFHILASLLYFVTHVMGSTIIGAIKVVLFISVFLSGIFMYRFLLKVTNGNVVAATIGASLYIVYPYRIFDAFCRAAYAEAFSFLFIPLFFKGLHGIVNFKDKITVLPFVEVILGGSLLFLSHNLTAVFGFIFGIIYLLFNIQKIDVLIRKPQYWITGLISVIFLVGIMSINLFSTLELVNSGIYNISNAERMWTTLAMVTNRINTSFSFSGFLNFSYMEGHYGVDMGRTALTTQIIVFVFLSILFLIIDKTLSHVKKLRYFHFLISAGVYIGLMFAFAYRLEVILGATVVVTIYFLIETLLKQSKNEEVGRIKPVYKELDFWFLVTILLLTFVLITQKWIWRIMPEQLLMIQFPWRLWAFIQFFASWTIAWLCHKFRFNKAVPYVATIAIGFCLVTNQALPEKRLVLENINESTNIYYGDENYFSSNASIGWNREYIPRIFSEDDYVPEYDNTLYYAIKVRLRNGFNQEYPFDPLVIYGDCDLEVTYKKTPNYELAITASEESLIQMPLLYYPGYQIKLFDEQGLISKTEGRNVDGLVSFLVDEDVTVAHISYIGTPLVITSYVFFGISLIGTAGMVAYYKLFLDKKKKDELVKKKK
jgi:hypothetical protein